LRNKKI